MSENGSDPYNLARFVEAQAPVIDRVLEELRRGRKDSHWMWFVFPQIAGLGRSATAQHFGLVSLGEAEAYLSHPLLGERLRDCTALVMGIEGRPATAIFGTVDSLKFRSCMTLFAEAEAGGGMFRGALAKFYEGQADPHTLERIEAADQQRSPRARASPGSFQ